MPPRSAPLPGPNPVTKNVMLGDCGGGCCASASKHPLKSKAADATKPRPIAVFIPSLSYFDQDFPRGDSWNYSTIFLTKSWRRHLIQRLAATCDSYAIDVFVCLSVPVQSGCARSGLHGITVSRCVRCYRGP